ncbi:cupin domain-containing protein [candidate division KSB1 bacterium]
MHKKTIIWSVSVIFLAAAFFAFTGKQADIPHQQGDKANVKEVLSYEESGSKRTAIDEVEFAVGEKLPLDGHPEERLYYILDGRGIMSIYEDFPDGDVYELRQDVAIYMTPGMKHEIFNTGNAPLRYVIFKVKGGLAPEGEGLSWTAVTQEGDAIDKTMVGAGQATTYVFDEGLNPSFAEGLHLRIRHILLRRPQKFSNAEVLTIAPGRSTRLHTHYDTGETCYILVGEGNFIWDDKEIPCKAGSAISYPVGVQRQVQNTGDYPLSYICISSFLK